MNFRLAGVDGCGRVANDAGGRGRSGNWGRHPVPGLHHRVLGAVQGTPAASSSPSTSQAMTPTSTARSGWSAMRKGDRWRSCRRRSADHQLRRVQDPAEPPRLAGQGSTPIAAPAPMFPEDYLPTRCGGDRRGAADLVGEDHCDVRGRHHAGRAEAAVAGATAGRLPHGIRLFLHGLRDCRRHGAQARPARSGTWSALSATAPT